MCFYPYDAGKRVLVCLPHLVAGMRLIWQFPTSRNSFLRSWSAVTCKERLKCVSPSASSSSSSSSSSAPRLHPDETLVCHVEKNELETDNQSLLLILTQLHYVFTGSAVTELHERDVSWHLITLETWASLLTSAETTPSSWKVASWWSNNFTFQDVKPDVIIPLH